MLATPSPSPRPSRWRVAWRAFALSICALWAFGAVLFLLADGSVTWAIPEGAPPPVGEHNLALFRFGPTVRASSYHRGVDANHHPGFLVDGHSRPNLIEKWASAIDDRTPWTEILWRQPRTLTRVVVRHAGWREEAHLSIRNYRVTCLATSEPSPTVEVTENAASVSTHPLACAAARGIRIDWEPNQADDLVRVYEVEAWGQ